MMLIYAAYATINETEPERNKNKIWNYIDVKKCSAADFKLFTDVDEEYNPEKIGMGRPLDDYYYCVDTSNVVF